MLSPKFAIMVIILLLVGLFAPEVGAQELIPIPDGPAHYNAYELLTYHLMISHANWDFIRYDLTETEVPALFWATGEEYGYAPDAPILVSIRRKSCDAYPNELDPQKVSLKIDINEYYDDDAQGCAPSDFGFLNPTCVNKWHQLKKLDLQNGDDTDPLSEGFAYYLHEIAAESELDYAASDTAWVKMYITLVDELGNPTETFYNGVFVNLQQRDDQFLKNYLLWEGSDDTWLYKYGDRYSPEYEEAPEDEFGEPLDSPAFKELYFAPFQNCNRVKCLPQPTGQEFVDALNKWINMEGLLTYGAVSAFHVSPDDLFSHNKNYFFVDYSSTELGKREYIEWDLDSVFTKMDATGDIYNVSDSYDDYEDWIIDTPGSTVFREQYSEIMRTLLNGPFQEQNLIGALNQFEVLLTEALATDAYNGFDGDPVDERFYQLRSFISSRIANVESQLPTEPVPPPPPASVHVGDLDGTVTKVSKFDWTATVRIAVDNNLEEAVVGALVYGTWSGGYSDSGSCVTVEGTCSVVSGVMGKLQRYATFTVDNVVDINGLIYAPGDNHDPDGDSDGTAIKVTK